jgi:hypothetical protein
VGRQRIWRESAAKRPPISLAWAAGEACETAQSRVGVFCPVGRCYLLRKGKQGPFSSHCTEQRKKASRFLAHPPLDPRSLYYYDYCLFISSKICLGAARPRCIVHIYSPRSSTRAGPPSVPADVQGPHGSWSHFTLSTSIHSLSHPNSPVLHSRSCWQISPISLMLVWD